MSITEAVGVGLGTVVIVVVMWKAIHGGGRDGGDGEGEYWSGGGDASD